MKPERKPQLSTEIHASIQERNNMRKLMSIALFVVCCTGLTSNAFAANCFCKFYVNGTEVAAKTSPDGGFLQTTCLAQAGCHDYCKGYLDSGNVDAAAAAHRCGSITITMQTKVGTESYCSNSHTRIVTGTGTPAVPAQCPPGYSFPGPVGPTCVIDVAPTVTCGSGYWQENSYLGQPHAVCVKQACPQGTMPGAPAWHVIFGSPSSAGGAYATDDHGGTRQFIDATLTCQPGYALSPAGYKPGLVCRKSIAAIPAVPCH
jgi:hypothetical protein